MSRLTLCASPGSGPSGPNATEAATDFAAYASAHERVRTQRLLQVVIADGASHKERAGSPGAGRLPEGFVPIREARHLGLLGHWPLLDDRMPACLPLKLLLWMQRRCEMDDPGAAVWLKAYRSAYAGDVAAQYTFGKICENGIFRAPADRQRAFFWYHRAALRGHVEARMAAERLARETKISPAATAAPMLVYPGTWRITAAVPGLEPATSRIELHEDGTVDGGRLGANGMEPNVDANGSGIPAAPLLPFWFSPAVDSRGYCGHWSYDNTRQLLTIARAAAADGWPRSRSDAWQIQLVGCKVGGLFGRDARNFSYTLEHEAPNEAAWFTVERPQ